MWQRLLECDSRAKFGQSFALDLSMSLSPSGAWNGVAPEASRFIPRVTLLLLIVAIAAAGYLL